MDQSDPNTHATRETTGGVADRRVDRLIRPAALTVREPLVWSAGAGSDVWDLFCACMTGDLETVTRLVRSDPSLVRAHYEYRTPLSFAVRENQRAVAAFLLDQGAPPFGFAGDLVETARDRGYTGMEALLESRLRAQYNASPKGEPVAAAIRQRDVATVEQLLDQDGERLHAGDKRSNQPIHWAVMTRQIPLIDNLLARGADINAGRADGARPIHLTNGDYTYRGWRDVPSDTAATPGDVYRHLVHRGAEVDLGMAAASGDLARVLELIERDPAAVNRVAEYGSYYLGCGAPIKNAAATGHIEIVRLLLERGADPNLHEEGIAPRGHALYSAGANGHFDIVTLLLEHGAHPNVEVESSADTLSRAISNGDQRMIDLLCSHGAARRVHLLAYYDDIRTAAAVFAADPALADDPEALGNASSEAFVLLMLRYRPDLPTRIGVGRTRDISALLLRHGMNPNLPNWLRITALHRLAAAGDVEHAALLVDHGAALDARDEELRSTPLAHAARAGHARMVEFLLQRGARRTLPDDPPWATPLAWAIRRGHEEIVRLLTDDPHLTPNVPDPAP